MIHDVIKHIKELESKNPRLLLLILLCVIIIACVIYVNWFIPVPLDVEKNRKSAEQFITNSKKLSNQAEEYKKEADDYASESDKFRGERRNVRKQYKDRRENLRNVAPVNLLPVYHDSVRSVERAINDAANRQ